jgi:hypothetical protein
LNFYPHYPRVLRSDSVVADSLALANIGSFIPVICRWCAQRVAAFF